MVATEKFTLTEKGPESFALGLPNSNDQETEIPAVFQEAFKPTDSTEFPKSTFGFLLPYGLPVKFRLDYVNEVRIIEGLPPFSDNKEGSLRLSFDDIFSGYRDYIYRHAFRLTYSGTDAEDLTQQAFLRTFRALPEMKQLLDVGPWLYRVATNIHIDQQRKEALANRHLPQIYELSQVEIDPQEEAIKRIASNQMRAALQHLSLWQRNVIVFRQYNELTFSEISGIIGLTPSGTRKAYNQALAELGRIYRALFGETA